MERLSPRLTRLQKIIVDTIQESEGLSQRDLARAIEVPFSTVNRQVKKLAEMGILRLEKHGITVRCYLMDIELRKVSAGFDPISLQTRP
jgi:Mn-dependent DtxR family transcriptional regulator